MEYHPPSLDRGVLERSWRASNGERGVMPEDANAFLDACERDSIRVLGWEMWLVEHQWDRREGTDSSIGMWTGLIPDIQGGTSVWTGEGGVATTRKEIATLQWEQNVPPQLHPYVRFNFTLDV